MRLIYRFVKNNMFDYEEYCADNINDSAQYFYDKCISKP